MRQHVKLLVEGMVCHSCVDTIEKNICSNSAINSCVVSLEESTAYIEFEDTVLSTNLLIDMIEDLGFNASEMISQNNIQNITVKVKGMVCMSCVQTIESTLKNKEGIFEIKVDLKTELAEVKFDKFVLTEQDIVYAIEALGFDAVLQDPTAVSQKDFSESSTNQLIEIKNGSNDTLSVKGTNIILLDTFAENSCHVLILKIEGMTCSSCVHTIETNMKQLVGIQSIKVTLMLDSAQIIFDPSKIVSQNIVDAVNDLGFDAAILSENAFADKSAPEKEKIQFKILGMTCASCSSKIEREMKKEPGIISSSVNLLGQIGTFEFNPFVLGPRNIAEKIESLGFQASPMDFDVNSRLESLQRSKETDEWRRTFITGLIFTLPLTFMSLLLPILSPNTLDITVIPGFYLTHLLMLLFSAPVQYFIGLKFYSVAYKSLKHGAATMDVLVSLGTGLAFFFSIFSICYSVIHFNHPKPTVFFEMATTLLTFVSFGRYLENRAKGKTTSVLSELMTLAPHSAILLKIDENSGEFSEKDIPTDFVQKGDLLKVLAGSRIPADGIIHKGTSTIDESMVTGESVPIFKQPGDSVIGGTVNCSGTLFIVATKVGSESTLSQIIHLVNEAQTSKAPIQAIADKISGYFVPAVISLGIFTFVTWSILFISKESLLTRFHGDSAFYIALKFGISVIVVACPCALGLATPTAVMVGTGVGAKLGILIKGGQALESGNKIDIVVLDKTGTITEGKTDVVNYKFNRTWAETDIWKLIGSAESSSEHPLGRALVGYAKRYLNMSSSSAFQFSVENPLNEFGKGISCTVKLESKHVKVHIGNFEWMLSNSVNNLLNNQELQEFSSEYESLGHTIVFVSFDLNFVGVISISDSIRPEALLCVKELQKMKIQVLMVTGDREKTARKIADACGIKKVYAGISPAGKKEIVETLQKNGHFVAMVGDGVNDSASLAQSNMGIAVYGGTDVAMEAADVVLMKNNLVDVVTAIDLSRTILRRIRLNFLWATFYNALMIPLAMGAFIPFGIYMNPVFSGFAMSLSSVSVVISSLLLKKYKRPKIASYAAEYSDTMELRSPSICLSVDEHDNLLESAVSSLPSLQHMTTSPVDKTTEDLKFLGLFKNRKHQAGEYIELQSSFNETFSD